MNSPRERTTSIWSCRRRHAFVSSDLHRCIPGRIDHSARLDTKYLYEAALDHYADAGFHLIENGDVEDFWMVGGTMEGTRYDISRIFASLVPGQSGRQLRTTIRNRQLDQIVDNNIGIYRRIRNRFAADGRYWRTIGNHDDVYADPTLRQHLRTHVPGVRPVNHLVLRSRAGVTKAVITHGHHTDGWNAPGRANLGRLASWAACMLTDLPFLSAPEGLPTREESAAILAGTASNSLVAVDPRFGANRHYDSLDEELLFSAVSPHLDQPPSVAAVRPHPLPGVRTAVSDRVDLEALRQLRNRSAVGRGHRTRVGRHRGRTAGAAGGLELGR